MNFTLSSNYQWVFITKFILLSCLFVCFCKPSYSQDVVKNEILPQVNAGNDKIQTSSLPSIPVMKNSGNPEQDAADYEIEKAKWIEGVLFFYRKIISQEQKNMLKEILKKENPEDLLNGKIIINNDGTILIKQE